MSRGPNKPMPHCEPHEPTSEELNLAREAFEVELVSFKRELEKLDASEFLPRYNRLKLKILCRAPYKTRPLFLTVRRHGSKIATQNFYTVPFFAEDLPVGFEAEYELLSFDSFALPFQSISVEMCQPEDYHQRRVSAQHLERAKRFAVRANG
jgi:hypothetical protein